MVKNCLNLLFLLFSIVVFSQETKTFPLPDVIDDGFVDRIFQTVSLDNKKIVVLGEENHGGEYTNQINAAIIHYLVTTHGFNTLVFESDFFGLQLFDTLNKNGGFRTNVFPAWSASSAFEKVEKLFLEGELKFLGFDSRHHGENSENYLIEFLKKHQKDTTSFDELFYILTKSLVENEFKDTLFGNHRQEYISYIEKWQNSIIDSTDILFHVLRNLKNYAHQLKIEKKSGPDKYIRFRERAMIENMTYLLQNKDAEHKYIVIGASLHTQPGFTGVSEHAKKNVGDYIYEHHQEESLFLLPVVYSGKTQNYSFNKPQKVAKRGKRKTLQRLLSKKDLFTLIDYCYKDNIPLYSFTPNLNKDLFCGYFIFIREESPRMFFEKK